MLLKLNLSGLVLLSSFRSLIFAFLFEQFPLISFSSTVRDLCVTIDRSLTFSEHTSNLTRSSYCHLRRLRVIRRPVSSSIFSNLIHAFICFELTTATTFSLFFLSFISLQFSWSSIQL